MCLDSRVFQTKKIFYLTNGLSKLYFDCIVVFFYDEIFKTRPHLIYFDDIFSKTFLFVSKKNSILRIIFILFRNILFSSGTISIFEIFLFCFGTFYFVLEQFASLEHFNSNGLVRWYDD